ncbi:MAG: hypothetical protein AAGD34_12945 [Pseudomonadota bacterium]
MIDPLPRLKPHPVPAIHPVPEHAADGRLASVYTQTKNGLGVPWMGVVAMAFAHYPVFYSRLWSALEPIVGRACFAEACAALRAEAEAQAATFSPSPLGGRLTAMGYGEGELTAIRACIEVFAAGNMPYIVMATLARGLLEGRPWTASGDPGTPLSPPAHPKPVLMESHHATPETQALYDDIKTALGLPFVNTDYRALARWPSYFDVAWTGLRGCVTAAAYEPSVEAVHRRADALSMALPNASGVDPAALADAAREDAPLHEVLDVVRLFQWLLPGLAVNVAILQAQLAHT